MGKLKKGVVFMSKEKPRFSYCFVDGGRKSTIAKKQRQLKMRLFKQVQEKYL